MSANTSLGKQAKSKNNVVTSYSCYFNHFLPLFCPYGLESLWDCTEFIRPLSHLPLMSGHAMVFTCYFVNLFINSFYS